jgi:GH3 auxin-responsive promoter
MAWLRALLAARTRAPYRSFLARLDHSELAQSALWRRIAELVRGAPFWQTRAHSLALADFDITTYDDYRGAIARDLETGISSLNGEPVRYWNETSGTTGGPKLFPLTDSAYDVIRRATLTLHGHWLRAFPGYLARPTLNLFSPASERRTPTGVPVGLFSYYNHLHKPQLLRRAQCIPLAIYRDARTFAEWAPVYALAGDISAIQGMAPSRLHGFFGQLAAAFDQLERVARGTLVPPLPLAVTPERLRVVQDALAAKTLRLRALWPALELVSCWTTSSCALQLPRLRPHLGDDAISIVDHPYGASEGLFNLPLVPGSGGHASLDTAVLEFVRAGDAVAVRNLVGLTDLVVGEDYELIVTTAMGLVRYRMFDVVRCLGYVGRTPTLAFVHKSGRQLSLGGGGTAVIAERELVEILDGLDAHLPGRWIFGADRSGTGLAFFHDTAGPHVERDIGRIHRRLCARNAAYRASVESGALAPIRVARVPASSPALALVDTGHAQAKQRVLLCDPRIGALP